MIPLIPILNKPIDDPTLESVQGALAYIDKHWKLLHKFTPNDTGTLIGLPYPYIVPAAEGTNFNFEEQYYWDSYFIAIGYTGKDAQAMVEGMLENLLHLRARFGMIPNASRMYFTSRSQPPMLTSYIFYIYDTYGKSKQWLQKRIKQAEKEYQEVWMSTKHPHWRNVDGLNRYYDINALHDLAEAESGWDMTTRFERKCLDFLPIDLNALLYKYETDFARAATILGDDQAGIQWRREAALRKSRVDELMWSKARGFYFDYNSTKQERSGVWSLAAFYAMWSGMASTEQAAAMMKNLSKFEQKGGLTTTTKPLIDMSIFGSVKTQWTHPNGWAPLHYLTAKGLERYGYDNRAKNIALKWVTTNLNWFNAHNEFLEKYNVVQPTKRPLEGVYPSQTGFGWSNAVFAMFCRDYLK